MDHHRAVDEEHQRAVDAEESRRIDEQEARGSSESDIEEGSGVGNLEHQRAVDAEESRRIDEQEAWGRSEADIEVGSGRSRSVHFADAEVGNLDYEIHIEAGRGVANLSRLDAAFAAWQASQDAAFEAWQASQRRIAATAIAEHPLRVDAAFEAWQASQRRIAATAIAEHPLRLDAAFEAWQQRRYERILQYAALGWETKVLLVAIRMGHLLKNFDECERCKMMQLGISWWREVCVFPPIFVNETSLNYMEVIQSDRLGALQPATPLAKGLTTLLPIGHHILDGKLFHES
jgi:hypothetical protein